MIGFTNAEDSSCGDWEPYKEEKCLKIFNHVGLKSFTDAVKVCKDNDSTLITIYYKEEQDFITKYLKDNKIADNVWIGIKYTNKVYKWNDNSSIIYKNWAEGSPKNLSDHCSQFMSDETWFGKWSDVLCTKQNLVVCQKPQTWSMSHLQKVVLDSLKNPVPIGFIFDQLPNEKAPEEFWPWMIWKDISSAYEGAFFRASSGKAAEFGKVQEENVPRVTEVDTIYSSEPAWNEVKKHLAPSKNNATLPIGDRSLWVYLGTYRDGIDRYASFVTSDGEVRPKNMAMRIWKRMG